MNLGFKCIEAPLSQVSWLWGEGSAPENYLGLLAYCTDGIVWGRYQDSWKLSSGIEHSPDITEKKLLEVRLFGETQEAHFWKLGGWQGRIVCDLYNVSAALSPIEETYLLLGEPGESASDFVLHKNQAGRKVVMPTGVKKLRIRHYLEQEQDGVVRVVVSRIVRWEA